MERFDALLPAAELPTRCKRWKFANSDETYDVDGLLVLADTADSEDPSTRTAFMWFHRRSHRLCNTARTLTGCFCRTPV